MKVLVLVVLLGLGLFAEDDWGLVCTKEQVTEIVPLHMEIIDKNDNASSAYDIDTLKIDHKNKTFTVWTLFVSAQGGKFDRVAGYARVMKKINYSTKRYQNVSLATYNCNGSVIWSSNPREKAEVGELIPGSVDMHLRDMIVEKYKL